MIPQISQSIEDGKCVKQSISLLKQTKIPDNESDEVHSANICVVCDRFIIGIQQINWLKSSELADNEKKLSVTSFEDYYRMKLPSTLREQYCIDDDKLLDNLLLSKRSKKSKKGYMCCASCKLSLVRNKTVKGPPRLSIANGFVIGHVPASIMEEHDITELVSAMIAPVRPFSYSLTFSGGALKTLKGHHTFFENNVGHIGSVLNNYLKTGANPNVYCVMCGRFTIAQRQIARIKCCLDAEKFMVLIGWYIDNSGHSDFIGLTKPDKCPQPMVLEDGPNSNTIDEEINPVLERVYEGSKYYFPSAYEPTDDTGTFKTQEAFATAMMNGTTPTLLFHGGNFASSHKCPLHSMFPIQFPFGLGGLDMKRRTSVSDEECIRHYMQLSLPQFHRQDVILVMLGIYHRIKSFQTGIIQYKSKLNDGTSFAEGVSKLTSEDICRAVRRRDIGMRDCYSNVANRFLNSVSTFCRPIGQSNEAAKYTRRQYFALWDRFGPQALFFTLTPDDECSFRVRLYSNGGKKVNIY